MSHMQNAVMTPRRFRSSRTIAALILREMSTTYGRSPGGYVWAILEPVAAIAVLSAVFSAGFKSPPIGNNFPLFFAAGYLPFALFNEVSLKIAQSLRFSKQLLAYPAVKYTDAILARLILNTLTQLLVAFLVVAGIEIIFDLNTIIRIGPIFVGLAMAVALGFGIGTMNCYLMTAFPVWERVWRIATRPLVLISGVIFLYENMPTAAQDILWYNPLVHVTGVMRRGFFISYEADYVSAVYAFGTALVLAAFGMLLLYRNHQMIQNN